MTLKQFFNWNDICGCCKLIGISDGFFSSMILEVSSLYIVQNNKKIGKHKFEKKKILIKFLKKFWNKNVEKKSLKKMFKKLISVILFLPH